jgi:SAM-dependent methyltransferase
MSEESLPRVVVCSLFRDMEARINKIFKRRLQFQYPKEKLVFVCVEGDSKDKTYERLQQTARIFPSKIVLIKNDTCLPSYGSIVHPARFRGLAECANIALETATFAEKADLILWLESDVTYSSDLILRLLKHQKDIIAPVVLIETTNLFYDVWAFRAKAPGTPSKPDHAATKFKLTPPYHPAYDSDQLFTLESAGSVLLFRSEVIARGARLTGDEAIVGFCRSARALGYRIWCDPTTIVYHQVPKILKVDYDSVTGQYRLKPKRLHVTRTWPWWEAKVFGKFQDPTPFDEKAFRKFSWEPYGRPLEYSWISARLSQARGRNVLDYGSGSSEFSAYLSSVGFDVTAVDLLPLGDAHNRIQKRWNVYYNFIRVNGRHLCFPDNYFDYVVAISSIEHDEDDVAEMKELSRVCKPGGRLLISLPYDHHGFWYDSDRPSFALSQYYYDLQSIFERLVMPIQARTSDFAFIRYGLPGLLRFAISSLQARFLDTEGLVRGDRKPDSLHRRILALSMAWFVEGYKMVSPHLREIKVAGKAIRLRKYPSFTHPANGGIILLQLENKYYG